MKFGKHLKETVNKDEFQDWKKYAVDYDGMKKVLEKDETARIEAVTPTTSQDSPIARNTEPTTISSTSDHSYDHSGDYATFWEIFERSQKGLDKFYDNQEHWAQLKQAMLKDGVEKMMNNTNNSTSIDEMIDHLLTFRNEVELVRDFLLVNQIAFSKILKKFDKRTLSQVRETKLAEILETHMYLDDNVMNTYLEQIDAMILQLSKNAKPSKTHIRGLSIEWSEKTKNFIQRMDERSPFFAKYPPRLVPTFEQADIEMDPSRGKLGQGQFCSVMEIRAFHYDDSTYRKQQQQRDAETIELHERKIEMQQHCIDKGNETNDSDWYGRYVIKQLNKFSSTKEKVEGSIDLAIECKFLSRLSHPNIIRLCGTSDTCKSGCFLILDRLQYSLHAKIYHQWRPETKRHQTLRTKVKFWKKSKFAQATQELWRERILALHDVAKGMHYLHERDILHRDLKPDNIGLDKSGVAKIFDFGLVKELIPQDRVVDDQYRASGRTGTRKYMAPENLLCKPYGKAVDVFSFCITAWETLKLQVPFDGMGYQEHALVVVEQGNRPTIPNSWPLELRDMLEKGWSTDPSKRPSSEEIRDILGGLSKSATGDLG